MHMGDTQHTCPVCGNAYENGPELLCYTCTARACLMPRDPLPGLPEGSTRRQNLVLGPDECFGQFRILGHLGSGGAGSAYEAIDERTGRHVAIKVLVKGLDSEIHRARFLREGRLAASIHHPNSVGIYGAEEIEGVPVISMELMRSGTLQSLVSQRGPLPCREAVDAILQVAAGLQAAVDAGVLHRDVKPSNCFLDTDGTVKIGDFGLSISGEASLLKTQAGMLMGTPAFSSPEQLRGSETTVASDIYSLGVTLYYLISGELPFSGGRLVELLSNALTQPPQRREGRLREIPSGLWGVLTKCLAKSAGERYQDYHALSRDLVRFSSKAPEAAPKVHRLSAMLLDMVVLLWLGIGAYWALLKLGWIMPFIGGPVPLDYDRYKQLHHQNEAVWNWILMGCYILYFAASECRWGRTVGKFALGINVMGSDGGTPTVRQALLRNLPVSILLNPFVTRLFAGTIDDRISHLVMPTLVLVASALLFVTARKRNGYAGMHDLWSGTRVVKDPAAPNSLAQKSAQLQNLSHPVARLGPFDLHVDLTQPDSPLQSDMRDLHSRVGHVLLGSDPKLMRKVWVRIVPGDEPVRTSNNERGVRPAMHPWLQGGRSQTGGYDAFLGFDGMPFLEKIRTPQSWSLVRHWLHDLGLELLHRDGNTAVDLEELWVTAEGRLVWLDFPAQWVNPNTGSSAGAPRESVSIDATNPVDSLRRIAWLALRGVTSKTTSRNGTLAGPYIPLSARKLLEGSKPITSVDDFLTQLRPCLLGDPETTPRLRRYMALVTLAISIHYAIIMFVMMYQFPSRSWGGMVPWLLSELHTLAPQTRLTHNVEAPAALSRLMAHSFVDLGHRPGFLTQVLSTWVLDEGSRRELTWICHLNHGVHQDRLRADEEILYRSRSPALYTWLAMPQEASQGFVSTAHGRMRWNFLALIHPVLVVAIPGILLAFIARGGLIQKSFKLAVVGVEGRSAPRWRILFRSLVTWAPLLGMLLLGWYQLYPSMPDLGLWQFGLFSLYPLTMALRCARPKLDLVDRLTGTTVVME